MTDLRNGDLIFCKNGHPMAEVVNANQLTLINQWSHAFGKWRSEPPVIGGPLPVCPKCGEEVVLPQLTRP